MDADASSFKDSKDAVVELPATVDTALAKRVVRKLDWRLMPIMFITYNFNFIDKTILSSASVFGLKEGTHLVGEQYSWVSSIFYFGYLFWAYPTSFLIPKLPVGKYVAINTVIWGLVVALTAVCTNFGGLAALRFLLGVVESTITPAFVFITGTYYTRDEIPLRTGTWFAGNSFGGLVASLLAYAIGRIDNQIQPWQFLFIIFGTATGLWGFILYYILPDGINSCNFLTEEEKACAKDRVALAGTGNATADTKKLKTYQIVECFKDPKTWLLASISICTQIPNSGTQNFANLVLKGFGFTSLETTLVGIPSSFVAFFTILITGWIAGRFKNAYCFLIIFVVIPPVVGSALIYSGTVSLGVQLFGYYLISFGPGALPLAMSVMNTNYRGMTKKMTMTALMFVAYCTGNIAGPHFFKASEAPVYQTAFRTIMVCYALAVAEALLLRAYLMYANRRRAGETDGTMGKEAYEDLTDWEIPGMQYRM
ncbi:major facilitator superfamily domain-containing protein [Schizophyllum commune]